MEVNKGSYISLVRATEEEIKNEYSEIIDGQIILDTTNKQIYCDEKNRRICYVGKPTQPSICKVTDNVKITNAGTTIVCNMSHTKGDYFYADNKLYRALADINGGENLTKTNAKEITVCEEFSELKTNVNDIINSKMTSQDGTVFQFGDDGSGNYGFLKSDGTLVPFKNGGVRLDPITITDKFNVPVVNGARYFGSFKRGLCAWSGYKIIESFGNVDIVEATANVIKGAWSGDDSGYNSNVNWLYKINGNLVWTSVKKINFPDEITGYAQIVTYSGSSRTSSDCGCVANSNNRKDNATAEIKGRIPVGTKTLTLSYTNGSTNGVSVGATASIYDIDGNYVVGLVANGENDIRDYASGNYWFKVYTGITQGDEYVWAKVTAQFSSK